MPQDRRPPVVWNKPDRPEIPRVTHDALKSDAMGGIEMGYNVYLPPGYEKGRRRYPLVFFLHGAGGDENSDAGGFSGLLTRLIDAGKVAPVVCVFPNGGLSGYGDHPERKVMVESFLVRELLPSVEAKFRTVRKRNARSLCGFSMGGGGSVRLALKHPDLFGAAASWAGALSGFGEADDPSDLARRNIRRLRGRTRLLLIVGDEDLTFPSHAPFLKTCAALKLAVDYRELAGVDHNLGVYYQRTADDLAAFVAPPTDG